MSHSLEIGENSCSIISMMAYLNSKEEKEDMCRDVCYSSRYINFVHRLSINVLYCSMLFILMS